MKRLITAGATDQTVYVFIQDSASTTGGGKTGIAYNAASLVCYYVRDLGSATALTLATQTVTGTHSDGGFVEVDATNMPGVYRLDLSDAVCAASVNNVVVMLKGAAGMVPLPLEIQLGGGQIATLTGHTAQTGDAYARLGAPVGVSISADVAAIQAKTTNLPASPASTTNITAGTITTVTNLTNAPTAGDLTATMKASVTAAVPTAAEIADAVWDEATADHVTAGTTGKKLSDISTGTPLDAAGVRAAIGLATANADAQFAALPTAVENADALLDEANGIETGLTVREGLRLALAALAGKLSGGGTGTIVIRNPGDTKNRITATVDVDNNRLVVVYDLT